ncbi:MAG: YfiR/HmsC family protein [Colwellia sp.]
MIIQKYLTLITIILFSLLSFRSTASTDRIVTFDDVKAHYILEVMSHITWPNENQITHFNIAILGNDKHLFNALNSKITRKIHHKSISIELLDQLNQTKNNVDVIVVNKGQLSLANQISQDYKDVLVISNGSTDKNNLMVGLIPYGKTIKLTLNRKKLAKNGFKIATVLLDFAGTKTDLKEQLEEKENDLSQVLLKVKNKEEQLKQLSDSFISNKNKFLKVQATLTKQNLQLKKNQNQLNLLKNSEQNIRTKLTKQKKNLLVQERLIIEKQTLLTKQNIEHKQYQTKLQQLYFDISETEKKLTRQTLKLEQKKTIIDQKEKRILSQRIFLYIVVVFAFISLFFAYTTFRVNKVRNKANKKLADLNVRLYELATTDGMTKIFNRRHFLELAQRELNQLKRSNNPSAVLMIDIDHFKRINDTYGHAAGDQAIISLVNILNTNLRDYDIVGRVGGEEFAMFLPNCEIKVAMKIAERIREKSEELIIVFQESKIKLTVSIGVTARMEDENDIGYLINKADKALYQAKGSGRNKVILL